MINLITKHASLNVVLAVIFDFIIIRSNLISFSVGTPHLTNRQIQTPDSCSGSGPRTALPFPVTFVDAVKVWAENCRAVCGSDPEDCSSCRVWVKNALLLVAVGNRCAALTLLTLPSVSPSQQEVPSNIYSIIRDANVCLFRLVFYRHFNPDYFKLSGYR